MLADPGGIVGLAARADGAADLVVRERARLESAAAGMAWRSTAASSFARRAQDGSDLLRRDVDRLEELAAALRSHARHVEDHLAVLADLEHRAEQLATDAASWIESHAPW